MTADHVDEVRTGYATDGPAVELGALVVDGDALPDVPVKIGLSVLNRHALVAGATGTGKTKTLQLMAEQLSAHGVPTFLADIKGDLSGLACPGEPGEPGERISARASDVGQEWTPTASPVELLSLGGAGHGVPVRATMTSFGPILLSKVLRLGDVQSSSLGLVFHFADKAGLPLLDVKDLRAVVQYLVSDDGKADLEGLGGLSTSTAGVILRELVAFSDAGADAFFGEPEFDTADLMRTTDDGRGVVTCLELPSVQSQPVLFSTFLMWLLADLFATLPEVGDIEKPKLVFFFDEAHLLFDDASPEFLKALKATASTFPHSDYDLEEVLTSVGTGEAVVTVLSETGAPTPVAWTRMRAPQSLMAPAPEADARRIAAASPLLAEYGTAVDRDSAYERLAKRLQTAPAEAEVSPSDPPPPPPPKAEPSVVERMA